MRSAEAHALQQPSEGLIAPSDTFASAPVAMQECLSMLGIVPGAQYVTSTRAQSRHKRTPKRRLEF